MHEDESREDYLERILMLQNRLEHVRSIDIVNDMGFSKPSVSIAMKKLRESGHILIDDNGYITLTDEGKNIAEEIYDRHKLLSSFLMYLGIDEEIAIKDACLLEHDLSKDSYNKIKELFNKMKES